MYFRGSNKLNWSFKRSRMWTKTWSPIRDLSPTNISSALSTQPFFSRPWIFHPQPSDFTKNVYWLIRNCFLTLVMCMYAAYLSLYYTLKGWKPRFLYKTTTNFRQKCIHILRKIRDFKTNIWMETVLFPFS